MQVFAEKLTRALLKRREECVAQSLLSRALLAVGHMGTRPSQGSILALEADAAAYPRVVVEGSHIGVE